MIDPTKLTKADWLRSLEISEAQALAGQTVPLEAVRRRIAADIAELADREDRSPRRLAVPKP